MRRVARPQGRQGPGGGRDDRPQARADGDPSCRRGPAARASSSGRSRPQDIVAAVADQAGVELDRRKVHLDDPIRTVGTHEVPVKLHSDVQFRITLEVTKSS